MIVFDKKMVRLIENLEDLTEPEKGFGAVVQNFRLYVRPARAEFSFPLIMESDS